MKKALVFTVSLFLFCAVPFSVGAKEDGLTEEGYRQQLESYDLSFFESELDRDTYSFLEELGLNEFSLDGITSLSLDRVLSLLIKILKIRATKPLFGAQSVLIYIILSAFFQSVKSDMSDMNSLYSTVSALAVSLVLAGEISPTVSLAVSSVGVASDFVFAFVPVFCAIVATSGGITQAFSTNAMLLTLAQAFSVFASDFFTPVINCFLGIGICSGLRCELQLQRVVAGIKKGIIFLLSLTCGAFVSVISIKTTVAARADILGIRSIRFVINSVVPVVGGALSEGLLSIQSYTSMVRSSVGTVGIIAICLVFLPAILETALWRLVMFFGIALCDVFGEKNVSLMLEAFRDTALLLNVVLIISMLCAVISFGILTVSGG